MLLGNNTPVDEIVACAEQTKAMAIALTFSITMDATDVEHFVYDLSENIVRKASHKPSLILGGSGVPVHLKKIGWYITTANTGQDFTRHVTR